MSGMYSVQSKGVGLTVYTYVDEKCGKFFVSYKYSDIIFYYTKEKMELGNEILLKGRARDELKD